MSRALATRSSGETFTSAKSGRSRRRATACMVLVTSTCKNSVTCGAVNALLTMAAAVCLRTPLIGVRCSRAERSTVSTVCVTACSGTVGAWGACAADRTSSRVTIPPWPVGVRAARSTPRSLASLRTGGLASGREPAGVTCSGCGGGGAGGAGGETGAGGVGRRRARRGGGVGERSGAWGGGLFRLGGWGGWGWWWGDRRGRGRAAPGTALRARCLLPVADEWFLPFRGVVAGRLRGGVCVASAGSVVDGDD